jgi:D-glycero-D-manno-heptose 1,7-bisphosphate phosphatase
MSPAIFLDRDGVIIENRTSYVRSWEDVCFYPQALEALCKVRNSPYKIFIVTNQSAVGRGIISLEEANTINQMVVNYVEGAGGRIDDVFMCPHAPIENCGCRKPLPGLFKIAEEKYSLNLNESVMVGDALSDIIAGQSAGILTNMLVRTGRGRLQLKNVDQEAIQAYKVFDDLAEVFSNLFPKKSWWIE